MTQIATNNSSSHRLSNMVAWFAPPVLATILCLIVLPSNYALFHMLAELSSIAVCLITLVLAVALLDVSRNDFVTYIGLGLGWTAGLDFLHMLAYEGMGIVPEDNVNVAAQFWLSARYLQALVLVTAPLFIRRTLSVVFINIAMLAYSLLSILLIYTNAFPDTFVEPEGLTSFKIYSEYLIIAILIAAGFLIQNRRSLIANELRILLFCALSVSILSELLFTLYGSASDGFNAFGHIAKIFAFWFIFLAIVRFNLQHPLKLLFQSANAYDLVKDAVIVTGPGGEIIEVNDSAAMLTRLNKNELLGKSAHRYFHARQVAEGTCPICSELRQNTASYKTQFQLEGELFDVYAKSTDDRKGSLSSIQLIRNVTEEVNYKKSIEKRNELIAKLSEHIPGVMYQYKLAPDGTATFPFATQNAVDIFGLNPNELERDASSVFDLIYEDDLQCVRDSIAESASNLTVWNCDFRITLPGNGVVWRSGHATPEKLEDGSILWHGFTSDSTKLITMNDELERTNKELRHSIDTTLEIIENMVRIRDPYTAGHEQRVGLIASQIAREMGWDPQRCNHLKMIGAVHDIGKIAVPAEILAKPTKLAESEYQLIKEHSRTGFDILKPIAFNFPLAETVLQHHERLDGSGYPQGLKGDQIIMEARIIAVADVFESMTSHRPYRPARTFKEALEELNSGKASLYDPDAVEALAKLADEGTLNLE